MRGRVEEVDAERLAAGDPADGVQRPHRVAEVDEQAAEHDQVEGPYAGVVDVVHVPAVPLDLRAEHALQRAGTRPERCWRSGGPGSNLGSTATSGG